MTTDPQSIELRQYTLFGGRRDTLIDLFEREFVHSQEAVGAQILGTFRDLDDPDRFVWLRGFADMNRRRQALETFYGGDSWRAHRAAANATMVDSDNVLLLRPLGPRLVSRGAAASPGHYAFRIFALGEVDGGAFAAWFDRALRPRLAAIGAGTVATFASETEPNDFPVLPVRGERVFAWLGRWPDAAAEDVFQQRLSALAGWRDRVPAAMLPALMRKPERLRLQPTARSRLR